MLFYCAYIALVSSDKDGDSKDTSQPTMISSAAAVDAFTVDDYLSREKRFSEPKKKFRVSGYFVCKTCMYIQQIAYPEEVCP